MAHDRSVRQFLRGTAALLIATSVCAQQTQQAAPSIPPPTIRVTTHMVLVDVVVTDKQGKAIPGLKPEDFVIEESGKAQKIVSLTTPADTAPAPGAELPPGIYSNKPQYRSTGAPITVMLLDALNTPFTDQAYARGQMLAFVKANFKPTDRMAVFTLTGPLNVLQDFADDPQDLVPLPRSSRDLGAFHQFGPAHDQHHQQSWRGVVAVWMRSPLSQLVRRIAGRSLGNAMKSCIAGFRRVQLAYAKDQRY